VLRSIAALAAILGVPAVLGGYGGAGKAASCSLYSHRWKMYLVFRGRPVPRARCSRLSRDLREPLSFSVAKGESNYDADKRVCVVHGIGDEADVYADAQAVHSEAVGRIV